MEVIDTTVDGNLTTYSYATTPSMSTYLLAVCCGKYDFVEGATKSGIKVRVYANRGEGFVHIDHEMIIGIISFTQHNF
jgi:aminopeptidase N